MLPLVQSFVAYMLLLVFGDLFEVFEVVGVLCDDCSLLQERDNVNQVMVCGKLVDIAH